MTARFAHWTDHAQAVTVSASVMATSAGRRVDPTDLAVGLLRYEQGNVAHWWRGCGFDVDRAIAALYIAPPIGPPRRDVRFGDETRQVLDAAIRVAASTGANHVGTEHLLAALVNCGPSSVVEAFAAQGVTPQSVLTYLASTGGRPGVERLPVGPDRQARRAWRRFQGLRTPQRSRRIWLPITAATALLVVFVVISML